LYITGNKSALESWNFYAAAHIYCFSALFGKTISRQLLLKHPAIHVHMKSQVLLNKYCYICIYEVSSTTKQVLSVVCHTLWAMVTIYYVMFTTNHITIPICDSMIMHLLCDWATNKYLNSIRKSRVLTRAID
jgi:hypothetical protein